MVSNALLNASLENPSEICAGVNPSVVDPSGACGEAACGELGQGPLSQTQKDPALKPERGLFVGSGQVQRMRTVTYCGARPGTITCRNTVGRFAATAALTTADSASSVLTDW